MRNKMYQWLWFKIIEKLIKVDPDNSKPKLDRNFNRMKWQIRIAKLFGLHRVFLGDSNCAAFYFYDIMKKFKKTTVNIGVGGTMPGDWLTFFAVYGRKIFESIRDFEIIINLGGNNILLNQMKFVKLDLDAMHDVFPNIWACTIPPLRDDILALLSDVMMQHHDAQYYHDSVLSVNNYIREIFNPKVIDLYQLFVNDKGEETTIELQDMVHYGQFICDKIRIILDEV